MSTPDQPVASQEAWTPEQAVLEARKTLLSLEDLNARLSTGSVSEREAEIDLSLFVDELNALDQQLEGLQGSDSEAVQKAGELVEQGRLEAEAARDRLDDLTTARPHLSDVATAVPDAYAEAAGVGPGPDTPAAGYESPRLGDPYAE
jgi:hypothetical protein